MCVQKNLVSICVPVYNASKYIDSTIKGFLNQTYKNIEIIIQDDFSTDGTWEIIQEYQGNSKVKIFRNEKNLGIGLNWNRSYKHANGEYVVIANADDFHEANFIELGIDKLRSIDVDFVSFNYSIFYERENKYTSVDFKQPTADGVYDGFHYVYNSNSLHIIFSIFKRELIERCLISGEIFMNTQICDFEFLFRYSYNFNKLYFINKKIGYYRIHGGNISSKPLGEILSYYRDVLPFWNDVMVTKSIKDYRKRRLRHLKGHLVGFVRKYNPFHMELVSRILRFYLASFFIKK